MSIAVRDLIQTMLYDLNETYARKHSDEEFINSINIVLRYVNLALLNAESYYITKETTLKTRNGRANLPADFAKFRSFTDYIGEYTFMGKTLKIPADEVVMQYLFTIPPVESIDDEIDLPYFLFELICRFVEGLIQGQMKGDTASQLIANEVEKLILSETSGPIERPMPFYV